MRRVLISVATATARLAGVATAPTAMADVQAGPVSGEVAGASGAATVGQSTGGTAPTPLRGDEAFTPPGSEPTTEVPAGEEVPQLIQVPGTEGIRAFMTRRRLLDVGASVVIVGGLLFAFLPDDERWGPIALSVPLAAAFWYLGERHRDRRQRTRNGGAP